MNYGAFIDIGGVERPYLRPVMGRIKHPTDVIQKARMSKSIQEINVQSGKISLSLKTSANDPGKTSKNTRLARPTLEKS